MKMHKEILVPKVIKRHSRETCQSIEQDPNNELTVVENNGELVGMQQLTFIPYLTHTGSWRRLIEGVRIAKALSLHRRSPQG